MNIETLYNRTIEQSSAILNTHLSNGLSEEEVKFRIGKYGFNELTGKKHKSFWIVFFNQFKSFMIIVLIIAAIISGVVGVMEGEGLLETYIILGILIVNAFIGAYQEIKAESSLEALKKLAAPETKVIRDGNTRLIPSKELVLGDLVILETGSIVPADIRLCESANLKIQESSLTGESVAVEKTNEIILGDDIALGDQLNMAFSSGMVTYGRGKGIVVATGMQTQVGQIANMLQNTEETKTPMSIRLEKLGKVLGIGALLICILIFVVGILYGNSALSMFMLSVSLAVAAIPEGLPAVSTVALALGVQRLVRKNAIIRTLPSVETLGSASIICSDKTGTLTQNKMTVVSAYVNHKLDSINRENLAMELNDQEKNLVMAAMLCADAEMSIAADGTISFTGDPTETALLDLGNIYKLKKNELDHQYPRLGEVPFDSERKRMSTINQWGDKFQVHVKGGVDEVLNVCNQIMLNGEVKSISEEDLKKIESANEQMAVSALRVLAVAYKQISIFPSPISVDQNESHLVFLGLIGMIDPARPEAIKAVEQCRTAGIKPVMITGDHKITAIAIAKQIGIFQEGDTAITGNELEKLSEEDLQRNVHLYSVYARVAPEHKVRIVKAWQYNKQIVAMTGDGVNDAPALKQADIGAAMGIVGTDVAKGAADMVLTDDNFATIVTAVKEGRRINDNIMKAIQFLLSTNVGEIFLLLITSIFNLGVPLLSIHILWINLVTDSLPALALTMDPAESNVMNRKPNNTSAGFLTKGIIWRIIYQGIMIGTLPLVAFLYGIKEGGLALGQTMAFASLCFAQLTQVTNVHSPIKSTFFHNPLKNKMLIWAILISFLMALAVLVIPSIREIFQLVELNWNQWKMVIILSLVPVVIVEFFKLLKINTSREEKNS